MDIALKLGVTSMGKCVEWKDADNPHIFITGKSGSGKSYFLRGLLEQAVQGGATCVALDYSNDFHGYAPLKGLPFHRIDVSDPAFTLNPLARVTSQTAETCAQRLMGVLGRTFRMGNRAKLSLRTVILQYLGEVEAPTLDGLLEFIDENCLQGTFYTPLVLLNSLVHSGSMPIGLELNEPGLTVLGFEQIVDRQMRVLLVELVLLSIWCQRTQKKEWDRPLILLLDEAQNVSWKDGDMAVQVLREGRKYGIGGWFSTQWLDGSKKDAVSALGQAALQVNFRPDDVNVLSLAKQMANGNKSQVPQYQKILRSLRRGQFLLQRSDGRAIIVNVPARNEKGGNEQR